MSDVYGRLVEAPADLPEWPIPKVEVLKIPKTVKSQCRRRLFEGRIWFRYAVFLDEFEAI